MPRKQPDKIKLLSKFLDENSIEDFENLNDIDEIIELPVNAFKFFKDVDVKLLNQLFAIYKIGQFAYLDIENPFDDLCKYDKSKEAKVKEVLQIDPELEDKIKKAITIARITHRIKKESLSFIKKEQKIIVIGLSNAGKTTILKKFGGQIGIKDLAKLKPTKGVERQEIMTSDMALKIWDFGGQKDYRTKYLQDPDKYFLSVDLVIYVIDLQDQENYGESMDYFREIIDLLNRLEQNPYVLIFLHKYDPDIKDSDEILLNVEYLKDLIKDIFKNKNFEYDIYLSSIYSLIANEPKFSKYLKNTMEETATLTDHKLEGMASIIETTLNGIIRLSESVINQYGELKNRIINIEKYLSGSQIIKTKDGKPMPFISDQVPRPEYSSKLPPPPFLVNSEALQQNEKPEPPKRTKNVRLAVLEELKDLFAKRKA